jgi:hypothetical protein
MYFSFCLVIKAVSISFLQTSARVTTTITTTTTKNTTNKLKEKKISIGVISRL